MSSTRRLWFWILLLIAVLALLATLVTSWNVLLVQHYQQMRSVLQNETPPWISTVLGSVAFLLVLIATVAVFVRLFLEMRMNDLQREFLAKVSHELKTPISTLELSSSFLKEEMANMEISSSEIDEAWQLHEQELSRLQGEVNSLLEAARWQLKPVRANLRRLPLETWIQESLPSWNLILGEKGRIRNEVALPHEAMVDPELMDLIARNIVENAKKFAKDEGPHVTLRAETDAQEWRLIFEDQGWGFSPRSKKTIFKRFHRDLQPPTHAVAGTGLGLFLARKAARAMSLRLSAESDGQGRGAKFIIQGRCPES